MNTKILVFKNGERFPILLENDGIPLFYPTVYETSMRRQVNVASATILADLSAIKFLYSWAETSSIDIEQRFHKGEFLTVTEIEDLTKVHAGLQVMGTINQMERELKAERASAGRSAARVRGKLGEGLKLIQPSLKKRKSFTMIQITQLLKYVRHSGSGEEHFSSIYEEMNQAELEAKEYERQNQPQAISEDY